MLRRSCALLLLWCFLGPWLAWGQVGPSDGGGGIFPAGSCVNQVVIGITSAGGLICATLTSASTNTSIAHTGVDINTSYQVTSTHLALPLPFAQGGTGLTSGAQGGLVYFATTSSLGSSLELPLGMPVLGGGAASPPTTGTLTGTTSLLGTVAGALTSNRQLVFDEDGNIRASTTAPGTSTQPGLTWNVNTTLCTGDNHDGKLTITLGNEIVCAADEGGDIPTSRAFIPGFGMAPMGTLAADVPIGMQPAGAANQLFVSDSITGATWRDVPTCLDDNGKHLNFNAGTHQFSCGTSSIAQIDATTTGVKGIVSFNPNEFVCVAGACSLATVLGGKTLPNTTSVTLLDTQFTLQNAGNQLRQLRFDLSGLSAVTRTLIAPDTSDTLVTLAFPAVLAGKSISGTTNTLTNISLATSVTGNLSVTNLNSGTGATGLTFWAGDGTWKIPPGQGTVTSILTTTPLTGGPITNTGTLACPTCVTSAAALVNNQLVFGAGSQGAAVGDLTGDVTTAGGKTTTLVNIPSTTPLAGSLLATNSAAPGPPASGKTLLYVDLTDKRLHDKNDAGTIGTTVVPDGGAANNFVTAISAAGVIAKAQPAFSNLSGSATCAQLPALTGDVTSPGGSCVTAIAPNAVTLAKMAPIATASFLGRSTVLTGAVEVLPVASVKTLLGLTGTNSGDQTITLTGDVTGSGTGSFAATVAANAVTLAKLQTIASGTLLGRATALTGTVEILTVLPTAAVPAFTGAISNTAGSLTVALTPTGVTPGSYTSANLTVNAAGQLTAVANGSGGTGLADPSGNGLVVRTSPGTTTAVTLTGTANQITVVNGSGVAGNPVFSIAASPTLPGTTTGTFSGNLTGNVTGNASTATALAVDPPACGSNQFASDIAANGTLTCTQPAFSNLAGSATSAQLPVPTVSLGGKVQARDCTGIGHILSINTDSTVTCSTDAGAAGGLGDPGANGLVVRTAAGTTVARTLTGTANQIIVTSGDGVLSDPTLSFSTNMTLPGTTTGIFSGPLTGAVTGNASTATALAANGANCVAGQFPLGVNASGAVESCTALPTSIVGTANQITASASTGAIVLSLPPNVTLPGTTTGVFFDTGLTLANAADPTKLAQFSASAIATLTTRTYALPDLSSTLAVTGNNLSVFAATTSAQLAGVLSDEEGTGPFLLKNSPTILTPTIASFVNATHSHITTAGGGQLTDAALSAAVTVPKGGTGLPSGTSGGVPYFNSTTTMASSALLAANALLVGGGSGAAPASLASLGTSITVLHGNAAGLPTFGALDLATDVSGNLAVTNLGSGTGASASTFWRGDGTWASIAAGSGDITDVGSCSTGACFTPGSPSASLTFNNATSGTLTLQAVPGALGASVISLPVGTLTLASLTGTETLSNKSFPTATITTSLTDPLLIGGTAVGASLTLRSTAGVGIAGADLIFQAGTNGATEIARMLNSGDVGIGVAAPNTRLHVRGPSVDLRLAGSATAQNLQQSYYDNNATLIGTVTYLGAAGAGSKYFGLQSNNADAVIVNAVNDVPVKLATNNTTRAQLASTTMSLGVNGTTNPALRVNYGAGSAATGLDLTAGAAGTAPVLAAISSGTDESLELNAKGAGGLRLLMAGTGNLSIGGEAARTLGMQRRIGAVNPGLGLTLEAGGAALGATNGAGGDMVLLPGKTTGTGRSMGRFQCYKPSASSGTTDGTLVDCLLVGGTKILANNVTTNIVSMALTPNSAVGVLISYSVTVLDASNAVQYEAGKLECHALNSGGTISAALARCTIVGNNKDLTSGTLAIAWTVTNANPAMVQVIATSSLAPSTGYPLLQVTSIENMGTQAIAMQ